jgi:hypothetical protein
MAHRPVGLTTTFTFAAGVASTSTEFLVQSSVLRVVVVGNVGAHITIGGTPSASEGDYFIPAGQTATLALSKASNRVVGVTTGTATIVTVPEGMQVPFGVGDYVTLTVSGQSYYDFTHQRVSSVDTTSNYDGYFQTKMTVDYNSSGIVTAFNSADATIGISNKVSAYGCAGAGGTIYAQQVQISGDA